MKDKKGLILALGKKRRNNRLEETLATAQGAAAAATIASQCLEDMLSLCLTHEVSIDPDLYAAAIDDCDRLEDAAKAFEKACGIYRSSTDNCRALLERFAVES